jgi:ABC-type lipoprotein release transport system permease subunit
MLSLLSMAGRNLFRNKRRSIITVLGISIGLALCQTIYNLNTGNYNKMLDTGIRGASGHVVVQHERWLDDPEVKHVIQGSTAIVEGLQAENPEAVVTRRVLAAGLVTSPTNAIAVGVLGVDPEPERQLNRAAQKMVEGEWLKPDDRRGLVLGDTLAKRLGVGIKGRIVVMAPDPNDPSESTSLLFRVRGIYHSGVEVLDNFSVIVSVPGAQPLLTGEDPVHQVAVIYEDDAPTQVGLAQAKKMDLGADAVALSWKEALPDLQAFIAIDTRTNDIFFFILGFIVILGVINTMLMSVLERVREFGVMMAVGMRPQGLAVLVLLEGFLLGLASAVVGSLIGAALTYPLATTGLDFSEAMGETMMVEGVAMDSVMVAQYDPDRMLIYAIAAILMTILASAWPAIRVSRMRPIQAIQHQ